MGGKPRLTGLPGGLARALDALAVFLARHQGDGAVIGGIAVIASGVPRVTRDVDVAFAAGRVPTPLLVAELAALGISTASAPGSASWPTRSRSIDDPTSTPSSPGRSPGPAEPHFGST